jgi:hypothetical protein
LVIVKKQNPQRERNGASSKPKASTPSYALDTAVVVIDEMTGSSGVAILRRVKGVNGGAQVAQEALTRYNESFAIIS